MTISFVGTWSYRSFVNNPDLSQEPNSLLFGAGTLILNGVLDGGISGTLGGAGWSLDLTGDATAGDPDKIKFQGKGVINGETWVYDYLGFVVPAWPNGVNQVDAIVGSIVRTEPHSGGRAEAGLVASWIAVRQN